jgi:hypothetical protein
MEECDWDMVGKLAKLGDVREDDIIISPKFMAGVRA